jgi:hypothetical protein
MGQNRLQSADTTLSNIVELAAEKRGERRMAVRFLGVKQTKPSESGADH